MAFHLQLRAIAQCEYLYTDEGGWGCVHTEECAVNAEGVSLSDFAAKTEQYFISKGWQFFGGTRCPNHAGLPPMSREEYDDRS